MGKIQFALLAIFAALGRIESTAPPSGKCNTENIVPVQLPIDKLEKIEKRLMKWNVLYATHLNTMEDHEYYLFSLRRGHDYEVTNIKVWKDNKKTKFVYREKYVGNFSIGEYEDENGTRKRFYFYLLQITNSLAGLMYRCSDTGDTDVYYRIIVAPADSVTSESEIQQLLETDRTIFGDKHGVLVKLPEKIPE